jgi:hypothetical protein
LDRANVLSGKVDIQSIILKAQMLMEIGNYKDAELSLRDSMRLNITDPILLASLALCVAALG